MSRSDVVRCLVTYTDWWQPSSTSVLQVGPSKRAAALTDGMRPGLLESLGDRVELRRRMQCLEPRERDVLFLWYVHQLSAIDIAKTLRISRRHCFRIRAAAMRKLVDLGETPPGDAEDSSSSLDRS